MKSLATIPLALLASTAPLAALDLFKVDPELTVRITIETQSQSIDSVKGDDGGMDNNALLSHNKFESRDTRYGAEIIQTLPIPVIPVPVGIHLGGGLAYTQRKMNLLGSSYQQNADQKRYEALIANGGIENDASRNAAFAKNDSYFYDINQLLVTGILGTEIRLPFVFTIDADLLGGIGSSQTTAHLSMVRTDGIVNSKSQSDLGLTYEYGARVGTHVLFFDALQVGVYAGWKEQRADLFIQHDGQTHAPSANPIETSAVHSLPASTTHERLQVKQNGIFFMFTAGVTF